MTSNIKQHNNELFNQIGELNIDENKETIIFIDKGDNEQYTNVYGVARFIKSHLKDKYNIITIGTSCKLTENYFQLDGSFSDRLLRLAENRSAIELNTETVNNSINRTFSNIKTIKNIIIGTDFGFRLPSRTYFPKNEDLELHNLKHEYFDYIGNDKEKIKRIQQYNNHLKHNFGKEVKAIAFITKQCNYMFSLVNNLKRRLTGDIISFVIDPANISFLFEDENTNVKQLYFADDHRGTRDFQKFPISQFQHILYDNKYVDMSITSEKTKNLFFGGTLFHTAGSRSDVWQQYLKDVYSHNCSYFIPSVKNNFAKSNKKHTDFLETEMADFYNDVRSHRYYREGLSPLELYREMDQHKYGIVFRCVSTCDSLNFKPILYVYKNMLPLFDSEYDPSYLQIPKHIQDKLVVHNSTDIDEKIEYYNNNEKERLLIIEELKKLFNIDEFVNNNNDIINTSINELLG